MQGGKQSWWGLRQWERCRIAEGDREVNMDLAMARNSDRKQKQDGELEGVEGNDEGEGRG